MDLLDLSATALARMIRQGEVTPLEVVDRHIARIEAVNPVLNAVVATRFDRARQEAADAAELLAKRKRAKKKVEPFLGVPITIKDFIQVEGMPNTGGIVARDGFVAEGDSTAVARLRAAGAIVLGVTNAPEGGLWSETNNRVYGRTSNPWDLRRTSGGSSGGEGAIVAAGGAPFGLGSDVGGSIRIPAALSGTVGHKPTGRLVPLTGHWPPGSGEATTMLAIGPLARRCEDLWPVLTTIAGPDGLDPYCREWSLGDPAAVDIEKVRVFPVTDLGRPRLHPEVAGAVDRAGLALEARGAAVSPWSSPLLKNAFQIWSAWLEEHADDNGYDDILGGGSPVRMRREVFRYPLGRSHHISMALAVLALSRLLRFVPAGGKKRFLAMAEELRTSLDTLLGDDGVLIYPVWPTTAPRHHAMILRPFDSACTGLFNVLELPATVVPVGFDRRGLPLAVQVVGRRGQDHLTIAVATVLEQALGGWVRAEPI